MNITKLTKISSGSRDRVRELVRIRDDHTCQCCKRKWNGKERRFDVHHLDEEKEGLNHRLPISYDRNNMDKLITYCHKCHLNLDHIIEKFKKRLSFVSQINQERNNNIFNEYGIGDISMKKIASKYGVTHQRIQQIIQRFKQTKAKSG